MNQQISIGDLAILFGGFLSLLLAIAFLIRKSQNLPGNYFLVFLMLDFFLSLFLKFFDKSDYIIFYPHLLKVNYVLNLLRPPLSFLYVYFIIQPGINFRLRYVLHFLPVILLIVYLSPFFILSAEEKLAILNGAEPPIQLPSWYRVAGLFYSFAYLITGWKYLKSFVKRNRDQYGTLNTNQNRMVNWINLLLAGYALYMVVAIANWLFEYQYNIDYYLYQCISLMVITACVRLMSLPDIVTNNISPTKKYEHSTLSESDKERYVRLLESSMEERKLYSISKIRLGWLAKELNMPEHHLSQLVNEKYKLSFNDYINRKRVERAKILLINNQYNHLTIEGIGYEVGFNSKVAFFTAFKVHANTTPKAFRIANALKSV